MSNRKPIGKGLRFSVFSRDRFSCRYCGASSDTVQLVVDHVTPVCQGGTNDPENLVTSCVACNAGKSGKTPTQAAPNETDRLRLAQEMREQQEAFERVRLSIAAREETRQSLCDYFCDATGQKSINKQSLGVLASFVEQHGVEPVLNWIDIAANKLRGKREVHIVKYICGIRRRWIEQSEQETA